MSDRAPAHRLVTLAFSHYNEKARWALDYCGVEYRERRYMPGFSQLAVWVATRGRGGRADEVSTRLSTPLLLTAEGAELCDSTDIARWASSRAGGGGPGPLFPEPAVLELVAAFGRELGPYTRLAAYWHALRSPTALRTLAAKNVGRTQALAFRLLAPLGARVLRRGLGISDAANRRATERVRRQIALAGERLAGRRYFVGDRFTAADLTFAALLAPVLLTSRAEGYSASFPALDELGPEAGALVAEVRASRAGAFALEMFRLHRRERWAA